MHKHPLPNYNYIDNELLLMSTKWHDTCTTYMTYKNTTNIYIF